MESGLNKKELGKWGEDRAKEFILLLGWYWLASNVKVGRGELDLLFVKGRNHLIVVEVKTKKTNEFGEPAELVSKKKIIQIEYLLGELLNRKGYIEKYCLQMIESWQLDVVAVYGDGVDVLKIVHFENVTMWT